MGPFTLQSPAFHDEEMIPARYTCQGQDINPPLEIAGLPEHTATLVLIFDDPDAPMGTWVHWVVWNILPGTNIAENSVPTNALQGKNSWGKNSYGGPCPPSGTHRYFFKLYALDTALSLPQTATKADVEKAMKGHILGETTLMGKYRKS